MATVAADLQPDVVAVSFEFDGSQFFIGGRDPASTRRHRNLLEGSPKVALILDDLASVDPWRPRGIRIYGTATAIEREGRFGPAVYHHIRPKISWSWGIEGTPFKEGAFRPRRAVHKGQALNSLKK